MKTNWRLLKYKLNTFNYKKINNKAYFNRYKPRLLAYYMYNEYGVESFIKTLTKYSKNKFFEILDKDFPNIKNEIYEKFKLIPNDPIDKLRVFTLNYEINHCTTCGKQIPNNRTYCSNLCAQNSGKTQQLKNNTQHNKNYISYTTKYKIKPENIVEFNGIYNNKQKFKIKCSDCDIIFETTGARLNENKYPGLCKKCTSIIGGDNQKDYYSKEYNCKECNNIFTATEFKYKTSPFCSNECKNNNRLKNIKKRVDENLKQVSNNIGLEVISSDKELMKYKTVKDFITFKCSCGNVFNNSIFNIQSRLKKDKRECICKNMSGVSNGELEVREFINELGFVTINNKYINNVSVDILCGEIGIEYDGLYWHSDDFKNKDFHKNKTLSCSEVGVNLLHIFSNEWKTKREIWESVIKNKLGLSKRIYARKCQLKEINSNETTKFLDNNHLQGSIGAKVRLGLYFNEELVSIMTFGKPRFNKETDWELIRFCNVLGCNVVGAASKLLSYFEKIYNPKSLISYANLRWSNGNLYEVLGFKYVGDSSPAGWYFKEGVDKLENRLKYQKHKLKDLLSSYDSELTADENLKLNNYKKIYDCGNMIYIKEYD